MNLNKKTLNDILDEIINLNDITPSDIPDIYLYMDQVTTLFENKLHSLKRNENDKIMTKTMINNYAKAKIFPPVKGKKYNKEQIILLALIYNLKQNLSLKDISTLFNPILEEIKNKEKNFPSVEDLYITFLEIKKNQLKEFKNYFNNLKNIIEEKSISLEGKEKNLKELILLVFMLITQANTEKRMAEKIIDNFFKEEKLSDNT